LAEAYQYLGYEEGAFPITEKCAKSVLSIPMYVGMTEEEQTRVIEAINAFV
jgi:dTDP-4-amino-4,6-dideoxygalactose transaminase